MYVRGKVADGMITDNCSKSGTQDVSTYVLREGENTGRGNAGWNSNMTAKKKL